MIEELFLVRLEMGIIHCKISRMEQRSAVSNVGNTTSNISRASLWLLVSCLRAFATLCRASPRRVSCHDIGPMNSTTWEIQFSVSKLGN